MQVCAGLHPVLLELGAWRRKVADRQVKPLEPGSFNRCAELGNFKRVEFMGFHQGDHRHRAPSHQGVHIGRQITSPSVAKNALSALAWAERQAEQTAIAGELGNLKRVALASPGHG
jgi:hypothetical protein